MMDGLRETLEEWVLRRSGGDGAVVEQLAAVGLELIEPYVRRYPAWRNRDDRLHSALAAVRQVEAGQPIDAGTHYAESVARPESVTEHEIAAMALRIVDEGRWPAGWEPR